MKSQLTTVIKPSETVGEWGDIDPGLEDEVMRGEKSQLGESVFVHVCVCMRVHASTHIW